MISQDFPSSHSKLWPRLLASLLAVSVTGTVWAGGADGERIKIQRGQVERPCSEFAGNFPFGVAVRNRGFLGVELTELTPELRSHFGVPADSGVMVSRVVEDSAAFRAGLAVGDIITEAGDEEISGGWELTAAIRGAEAGDEMDIEYWRNGAAQQVTVALDEREGCVVDLSSSVHGLEELQERLPEIQAYGLQISEEAMGEAMEALRNIDWDEHLSGLQVIEVDEEMEERLEELQDRMHELEERLSEEADQWNEDIHRAMKERERSLRRHHKDRIRAEREVRREMVRAQEEARRALAEARREQAEAMKEMNEERREAIIEAEMEMREARREMEEALREAAEEAEAEARELEEERRQEAAEEGGGPSVVI